MQAGWLVSCSLGTEKMSSIQYCMYMRACVYDGVCSVGMCVCIILAVNVCMLYVCWMLLSNQIFALHSTSGMVNSHFVNIDQMGIDKVGIKKLSLV